MWSSPLVPSREVTFYSADRLMRIETCNIVTPAPSDSRSSIRLSQKTIMLSFDGNWQSYSFKRCSLECGTKYNALHYMELRCLTYGSHVGPLCRSCGFSLFSVMVCMWVPVDVSFNRCPLIDWQPFMCSVHIFLSHLGLASAPHDPEQDKRNG